ncbi:chromate transporter [Anaerocolumna cellulosilytica]|uniref:Chromate transporter n=1 Tax=Anaerocolumna cellulosilytica TaxID=433286 RepID=A0A6S6R2H2_9FIRM|nr:chromate transporter [Anaerocolumna cellulosilytica]MBB5195987.1 chromate transporter [Anaerocolumna cellulosilytica]BCJ93715.1 chromate transporter [Anaerocolumna cellulosilytica]
MNYIKLFLSFFQVGLFSIGGGYASLPMIKRQVVELNHWLTVTEYTDLITLSGMTPGPIAINSSTFVGTRVAGLPGAIIATLGCILPSVCIVLLLAFLYKKFQNLAIVKGILDSLQPVVVALIASAGVSIIIAAFWGGGSTPVSMKHIDTIAVFLFCSSLILLRKTKINPIFIMSGSGLLGLMLYLIF